MWRLASLAVVGIAIGTAEPAQAQRGPGGRGGNDGSNDMRQLQADLDKLKSVLKDLEAKLKKAKDSGMRRDDRRPEPRGDGRFSPQSRGFGGRDGRPGMGRGPAGRSDGHYGMGRGPGGGRQVQGHSPGGFAPPSSSRGSSSSVERRLDKIEKDLEDLKRELRRKR